MLVNTTLGEQVYSLLRAKIVRGELEPGQRISPKNLAQDLGTSQAPVRDAVTRLASEGLISVLPRRGMFVVDRSATELLELMDVRVALELWAARQIIDRLRPVDLGKLRGFYEGMVEALARFDQNPREQNESFVQFNRQFHELMVELSGNAKLLEAYRSTDLAVRISRFISPSREVNERTNGAHGLIVEALQKTDWPSLREAVLFHTKVMRQDVLEAIASSSERPKTAES